MYVPLCIPFLFMIYFLYTEIIRDVYFYMVQYTAYFSIHVDIDSFIN